MLGQKRANSKGFFFSEILRFSQTNHRFASAPNSTVIDLYKLWPECRMWPTKYIFLW